MEGDGGAEIGFGTGRSGCFRFLPTILLVQVALSAGLAWLTSAARDAFICMDSLYAIGATSLHDRSSSQDRSQLEIGRWPIRPLIASLRPSRYASPTLILLDWSVLTAL